MTPETRLFWTRTRACSGLWMRVDWGDGKPMALPQQWIASPPCVPASMFDPSILRRSK
jgi:hypothetical protein